MASLQSILACAFAAAIGGCVFAVACGGEVDTTNYGPPSGLQGKSSTPTSDSGGAPPPATGDAGTTPAGICGATGPIDAGPCAKSWKTDIYPKMQAGGAWKCAASTCHAVLPPVIDGTDPDLAYRALAASKTGGVVYINPCSTDPTKSQFVCNTQAAGACGTQMPEATPGGLALTAQDHADIATWVACGAPEN